MNTLDRRGFLTAASLSLAASQGAAQTRWKPGTPFRIGCLNVVSYSHLAQIWAPYINARTDKKETPFTGMRITHCWEVDPEKSAEFGRMFNCEPVRNFDDMVGKVDGIISGGFYNHPWNHILHQPYLEAGLPNLINRPFSNSLAKSRKMIETAKKHNAALLCPSSYEYNDAITRARAWVKGKKILAYSATNSFDDYPTHGIHGLYMIHRAIAETGNPIVSVAYQAKSWHSPPGVMTFEHLAADGHAFMGALHQMSGSWGTLQIHTPEEYGGKEFEVFGGTDFPFNKTEAWAPVVWVYQRMAMYGDMPESFDQLFNKTRVFLAGWRSVLNGGRVVPVEDVPEDFESPVELPTHPGDPTVGLFRKKFGAGKV